MRCTSQSNKCCSVRLARIAAIDACSCELLRHPVVARTLRHFRSSSINLWLAHRDRQTVRPCQCSSTIEASSTESHMRQSLEPGQALLRQTYKSRRWLMGRRDLHALAGHSETISDAALLCPSVGLADALRRHQQIQLTTVCVTSTQDRQILASGNPDGRFQTMSHHRLLVPETITIQIPHPSFLRSRDMFAETRCRSLLIPKSCSQPPAGPRLTAGSRFPELITKQVPSTSLDFAGALLKATLPLCMGMLAIVPLPAAQFTEHGKLQRIEGCIIGTVELTVQSALPSSSSFRTFSLGHFVTAMRCTSQSNKCCSVRLARIAAIDACSCELLRHPVVARTLRHFRSSSINLWLAHRDRQTVRSCQCSSTIEASSTESHMRQGLEPGQTLLRQTYKSRRWLTGAPDLCVLSTLSEAFSDVLASGNPDGRFQTMSHHRLLVPETITIQIPFPSFLRSRDMSAETEYRRLSMPTSSSQPPLGRTLTALPMPQATARTEGQWISLQVHSSLTPSRPLRPQLSVSAMSVHQSSSATLAASSIAVSSYKASQTLELLSHGLSQRIVACTFGTETLTAAASQLSSGSARPGGLVPRHVLASRGWHSRSQASQQFSFHAAQMQACAWELPWCASAYRGLAQVRRSSISLWLAHGDRQTVGPCQSSSIMEVSSTESHVRQTLEPGQTGLLQTCKSRRWLTGAPDLCVLSTLSEAFSDVLASGNPDGRFQTMSHGRLLAPETITIQIPFPSFLRDRISSAKEPPDIHLPVSVWSFRPYVTIYTVPRARQSFSISGGEVRPRPRLVTKTSLTRDARMAGVPSSGKFRVQARCEHNGHFARRPAFSSMLSQRAVGAADFLTHQACLLPATSHHSSSSLDAPECLTAPSNADEGKHALLTAGSVWDQNKIGLFPLRPALSPCELARSNYTPPSPVQSTQWQNVAHHYADPCVHALHHTCLAASSKQRALYATQQFLPGLSDLSGMSHAFGGLRGWVNCGRSSVDASGSSSLTLQVMQIGKSSTLFRQIKLPASNRPREHRLTAPSAPGSTSGMVGVRTYMFHGLIRPTQLMPGQSARRDHYGPIEDALERLRCGNAGSTFIAPLDAVLNFGMVSSSQVATLCCLNRFLSKPDAFQSVLGGWSWGFHAACSAALTLEMAASSVRALFMLDARNRCPSPVNRWDPLHSSKMESVAFDSVYPLSESVVQFRSSSPSIHFRTPWRTERRNPHEDADLNARCALFHLSSVTVDCNDAIHMNVLIKSGWDVWRGIHSVLGQPTLPRPVTGASPNKRSR
ncbi:unnamed protein product, partial [Polarella glacialis]